MWWYNFKNNDYYESTDIIFKKPYMNDLFKSSYNLINPTQPQSSPGGEDPHVFIFLEDHPDPNIGKFVKNIDNFQNIIDTLEYDINLVIASNMDLPPKITTTSVSFDLLIEKTIDEIAESRPKRGEYVDPKAVIIKLKFSLLEINNKIKNNINSIDMVTPSKFNLPVISVIIEDYKNKLKKFEVDSNEISNDSNIGEVYNFIVEKIESITHIYGILKALHTLFTAINKVSDKGLAAIGNPILEDVKIVNRNAIESLFKMANTKNQEMKKINEEMENTMKNIINVMIAMVRESIKIKRKEKFVNIKQIFTEAEKSSDKMKTILIVFVVILALFLIGGLLYFKFKK
jgi:hypothetical protein